MLRLRASVRILSYMWETSGLKFWSVVNSASYTTVMVVKSSSLQKWMWTKVDETQAKRGNGPGCWQSVVCLERRSRKNNLRHRWPWLCQPKRVLGSGLEEAERVEFSQQSPYLATVLRAGSCTAGLPKHGCCTGSSGWSRKHLTTADFFL